MANYSDNFVEPHPTNEMVAAAYMRFKWTLENYTNDMRKRGEKADFFEYLCLSSAVKKLEDIEKFLDEGYVFVTKDDQTDLANSDGDCLLDCRPCNTGVECRKCAAYKEYRKDRALEDVQEELDKRRIEEEADRQRERLGLGDDYT